DAGLPARDELERWPHVAKRKRSIRSDRSAKPGDTRLCAMDRRQPVRGWSSDPAFEARPIGLDVSFDRLGELLEDRGRNRQHRREVGGERVKRPPAKKRVPIAEDGTWKGVAIRHHARDVEEVKRGDGGDLVARRRALRRE